MLLWTWIQRECSVATRSLVTEASLKMIKSGKCGNVSGETIDTHAKVEVGGHPVDFYLFFIFFLFLIFFYFIFWEREREPCNQSCLVSWYDQLIKTACLRKEWTAKVCGRGVGGGGRKKWKEERRETDREIRLFYYRASGPLQQEWTFRQFEFSWIQWRT